MTSGIDTLFIDTVLGFDPIDEVGCEDFVAYARSGVGRTLPRLLKRYSLVTVRMVKT